MIILTPPKVIVCRHVDIERSVNCVLWDCNNHSEFYYKYEPILYHNWSERKGKKSTKLTKISIMHLKMFVKTVNCTILRLSFHTTSPSKIYWQERFTASSCHSQLCYWWSDDLFKGTYQNLKNSRGRGVHSMTFKQVSIEREVILEF